MSIAASEHIQPPLSNRLLLALLILLLTGIVALCVMLFLQRGERHEQAYKDGRLIKIDVASGKISGNVTSTAEQGKTSRADRIDKHLKKIGAERPNVTVPKYPQVKIVETPRIQPRVVTQQPRINIVERPIVAPLASAPIAELQETLPGGEVLPRISDDGELQPWQYYSKPYAFPEGSQLLSVVITDLGMRSETTQAALNLNEYVTLAFSPYAAKIRDQMKAARASGFETWVMLPMQHEAYPINDYGPLTLLEEEGKAENINQLHRVMATSDGYVGLISSSDERFSRGEQMTTILKELSRRGLVLMTYNDALTSSTNPHLVTQARSHIAGHNMTENLDQLFREAEAYIQANGRATITLAPLPNVIGALNQWIATFPEKQIQLVPLSAQSKEALPR